VHIENQLLGYFDKIYRPHTKTFDFLSKKSADADTAVYL
jgi:hypothetical protein